MEIPDYSGWTSKQHVKAAESCLKYAAQQASERVEESKQDLYGSLEEYAAACTPVQLTLAEAQVHATLAVAKRMEEQNR